MKNQQLQTHSTCGSPKPTWGPRKGLGSRSRRGAHGKKNIGRGVGFWPCASPQKTASAKKHTHRHTHTKRERTSAGSAFKVPSHQPEKSSLEIFERAPCAQLHTGIPRSRGSAARPTFSARMAHIGSARPGTCHTGEANSSCC